MPQTLPFCEVTQVYNISHYLLKLAIEKPKHSPKFSHNDTRN